jgi:hypothetical protein
MGSVVLLVQIRRSFKNNDRRMGVLSWRGQLIANGAGTALFGSVAVWLWSIVASVRATVIGLVLAVVVTLLAFQGLRDAAHALRHMRGGAPFISLRSRSQMRRCPHCQARWV